MKYLFHGLFIGAIVTLFCWIAEDRIKGTPCLITNKGYTAICTIDGQKIHFEREGE